MGELKQLASEIARLQIQLAELRPNALGLQNGQVTPMWLQDGAEEQYRAIEGLIKEKRKLLYHLQKEKADTEKRGKAEHRYRELVAKKTVGIRFRTTIQAHIK
jgi:hypothetical protein